MMFKRSTRSPWFWTTLLFMLVSALIAGFSSSADTSTGTLGHAKPNSDNTSVLPAPPPPPEHPTSFGVVKRSNKPAALPDISSAPFAGTTQPSDFVTTVATNGNAAPGASTTQKTLILYDITGQWGWLGEAYAVNTANLVSHGSAYTMHPVSAYTAGEMTGYSSVVYIGSTYNEPIPTAFLDDVLSQSRPVLWMGDNIWQLDARSSGFAAAYGWQDGLYDFSATPTVTYKNVALNRDPLASQSGLLQTSVVDPTKASVVAVANRADGTTEPWAITGSGLTYLGEVPFSYVGPTDRYFIACDLLAQLANPNELSRTRALVRIEDVNATDDPKTLTAIADYLSGQGVPFTVAVIPQYLDPNGYYNNGKPVSIPLSKAPAVVKALQYMQSKGGTLIMHGYTHQYSKVANPYDGVSADDFEFYRAHIDAGNNVVYDSPPVEDSTTWAQNRVTSGEQQFKAAGFAVPTVFEPPHYAASAADYAVFKNNFSARYDRGLYFSGYCPNGACGLGTPDYTKIYGQYFPYLVRDIYGSTVIPEELGNVEPEPFNNHPAVLPADILANAHGLSVVRDGVASFFYHPYLGTSYLKQIVTGLKGQGYTFTSAATVAGG